MGRCAESITAYAPIFSARMTCTNFQDLVQRKVENIHDYYLRVPESFRRMRDAKPNTIEDNRANTGEARAQLSTAKKEGLIDMERFFLYQLFITEIQDHGSG